MILKKMGLLLLFSSLLGACSKNEDHPHSLRHPLLQKNYSAAVGLKNLGSTCFANAVHKLLWADSRFSHPHLATTPIQRLFFSLMSQLDQNWKIVSENLDDSGFSKNGYETELNAFYDALIQSNGGSAEIDVDHSNLRRDQADARVYLDKLIELLQLNEITPGFYESTQPVFDDGHRNKLNPDLLTDRDHLGNALPVPLPHLRMSGLSIHSPRVNSIEDAIREQFDTPERMDGNNRPRRSDNDQPEAADKYTYLTLRDGALPPSQMLLMLSRLEADHVSKSFKKISATQQIELRFHRQILNAVNLVRVVEISATSSTKAYHLKGVVIHKGTTSGGHYYTYLLEDQQWFLHDDSRVAPIQKEQEASLFDDIETNGYLFLYSEK